MNFSANVDDKFYGSVTAAIVREDGEDKVELEEAFVQTLPGAGLPGGTRIKFGRAFWTFGYLNEHHSLLSTTEHNFQHPTTQHYNTIIQHYNTS